MHLYLAQDTSMVLVCALSQEAGAEARVCRACTKPHRNVSMSSGSQQGMRT